MDSIAEIRESVREGRIPEALRLLELGSSSRLGREGALLKADLLQHVGRYADAEALLSRLAASKLTESEQAACEYTKGLLEFSRGNGREAVMHMQRAISSAARGQDLHRLCWSQLQLLHILDSRVGPDPTAPLLVELRLNAARLGDPQFHAALHIVIAIHDGKRGFWRNSTRHLVIAEKLLDQAPSAWLSWRVACAKTALSILTADLSCATASTRKALEYAEICGCSTHTALGNIGHLNMLHGHFDQAVNGYKRALQLVSPGSDDEIGLLDSLANACLTLARIDEARECVARANASITEARQLAFQSRHLRLTHARVLASEREAAEAWRAIEDVLVIAKQTDDPYLRGSGLILRLDVARQHEGGAKFSYFLRTFLNDVPQHPSDWLAHYEGSIAAASIGTDDFSTGLLHLERARRVCNALQTKAALSDVERRWSEAINAASQTSCPTRAIEPFSAGYVAQEVASMLAYTGRPRVLAASALAIFEATRCVVAARADAIQSDGTVETFASFQLERQTSSEETIKLGSANEHHISISFTPADHIESIATVNAIKLILAAASDLQKLRDEHQERLSLWPIGEFVPSQEGTIVHGCMNELMTTARRVASTHVSVLITGESGTGKEILARAIHHYSPRSNRPFIPFNCTAIPRDMLESQMFGHRRGAFTGADRDYPGLIRAAKEGTLFLDEVGELGLDLQPKLLRFLEAGEISPLGEPGPLTVNVRIVAATNRNLEELVQEGRFREDLFYRLNVVRLTIPPLRERRDEIPALVHHFTMRAAAEFNKGRIRVAEETMEHLLLHHWPGNIRELNNEIRRMIALADADDVLEPAALSPAVRKAATAAQSANGDVSVSLQDKLAPTIARIEREMIRAALRVHHGRVEAAAQALGISRKGLYLKRQRLGL